MSIQCKPEIIDDYLHVTVEGSLSSAEKMLAYIKQLHEQLEQSGVRKLLVNETKCHIHISIDDLKTVAEEGHKLNWLQKHFIVAVVSSDMNHPLFRHAFSPMKGIDIFSDEDSAIHWLRGQ